MADTPFAAVDLRETVLAGRGQVTDLSLSHRVRMPPPDLIVGAVMPALLRQYFEQVFVLGTSLYALPEVAGVGTPILDGVFQTSSQLNLFPAVVEPHDRALAAGRARLNRIRIEDEAVLLTGPGHAMYGHWLVDFLPKLYLLHRAGHRLSRLAYLLPSDTPAFARTWLGLLGIGADRLAT